MNRVPLDAGRSRYNNWRLFTRFFLGQNKSITGG